jgi:hypothetical protein
MILDLETERLLGPLTDEAMTETMTRTPGLGGIRIHDVDEAWRLLEAPTAPR